MLAPQSGFNALLPAPSRPLMLRLCKYICVAYLLTRFWGEQITLCSFLDLHSGSDCMFPLWYFNPQWGVHRCPQSLQYSKASTTNLYWPAISDPKRVGVGTSFSLLPPQCTHSSGNIDFLCSLYCVLFLSVLKSMGHLPILEPGTNHYI